MGCGPVAWWITNCGVDLRARGQESVVCFLGQQSTSVEWRSLKRSWNEVSHRIKHQLRACHFRFRRFVFVNAFIGSMFNQRINNVEVFYVQWVLAWWISLENYVPEHLLPTCGRAERVKCARFEPLILVAWVQSQPFNGWWMAAVGRLEAGICLLTALLLNGLRLSMLASLDTCQW